MPTISVVVPIYNRRNNLRLTLTALDKQSVRDFEVIVADDGSYDDPLNVLYEFEGRFPYSYVYRQHDVPRISRARNDGARLAGGSAVLFIDSDVMLNPTAIGHYVNLHAANPDLVICGRYDWLPPQIITAAEVHTHWEVIIEGDMPEMLLPGEPQGIIGPDPRVKMPGWFDSQTIRRERYGLYVYSGNLLVPKKLYWNIGGFDEHMTGHGAEDQEFGIRCQASRIPIMFTDLTIGYHVYHHRDQPKNQMECWENARYIARKYDLASLGIRLGEPGKDVEHLKWMR